MAEKRVVPPIVQNLLQQDVVLTNIFCKTFDKILPSDTYRKYFKILEMSCHAVPWLFTWLAFLWILWNPNYFEAQVNFFLGLLVDILAVTILKAAVRRRRPPGNKPDMFLTIASDVYSFPSGHMSRATYISLFFTYLCPAPVFIRFVLFFWVTLVALSRLLLRRHFILDILSGVALGWFELGLAYIIWMNRTTAQWLVTFISEENVTLEGLKDDNTDQD